MQDLDAVRERFPALRTDWALFDNAGGSAPLGAVIDAVREHLATRPVQLGAGYPLSLEAQAAVDGGRAAAARLVHAPVDEIVLGHSTTANVRHLAAALEHLVAPGDEVVVTDLDHESNVGPWRELAERRGARVREWRFDRETHALRMADLEALLTSRTRLVAFTQASNLVGTLHDVAAFTARIREVGALSIVDGVAFAPHRRVDVQALGADAYLVSLYKVFGPHLGLLHVRRELLERCASQNHFFLPPTKLTARLEPGGVQHELVACLPAIVRYLEELGAGAADPLARAGERIAEREAELLAPLLAFLVRQPGLRLLGRPESDPQLRVSTVSFTVEGLPSRELVRRLEAQRIACRFGHFYAYRLTRALGLDPEDGVVRASLLHYNTAQEVERLRAALERCLPRAS